MRATVLYKGHLALVDGPYRSWLRTIHDYNVRCNIRPLPRTTTEVLPKQDPRQPRRLWLIKIIIIKA